MTSAIWSSPLGEESISVVQHILFHLPRFEDPPSFLDTVKTVKTHQTQNGNINNLTLTHCLLSGIAFRPWEWNLVAYFGLVDKFIIRNQVKRTTDIPLRSKTLARAASPHPRSAIRVFEAYEVGLYNGRQDSWAMTVLDVKSQCVGWHRIKSALQKSEGRLTSFCTS